MSEAISPSAAGPIKKEKKRLGPYETPSAPATSQKNKTVVPLHYCELCKISCTGSDTYEAHVNGKKHKKNQELLVSADKSPYYCRLCSIDCKTETPHLAHIKGHKHLRALKLHTMLGKPGAGAESSAISTEGGQKKSVWEVDENDV